MKQTRPFSLTLTKAFKQSLCRDAKRQGVHYGVFFSTSGKAMTERINPSALYSYIFRTDKKPMNTTLKDRCNVFNNLHRLGIDYDTAQDLRRISMTLHRWYELECGNSNNHCSWAIERDEVTEKPFEVVHWHQGPPTSVRHPIADREKGALKRLAALLAYFPLLTYYVQTDPRGCSLYILKRSDVNGHDIEQVYNRGVAVY